MGTKNRRLLYLFIWIAGCGLLGCSQQSMPVAAAESPVPSDGRPSPDATAATPDAKNTVNVKFMVRGYCYAGSTIKDEEALGGFGRSRNMPKKIATDAAKSAGKCYLLAQPKVVTNIGKDKGMRLLLVNGTRDTVAFNACDSRLSIVQEAKDKSGKWKPIEYLPSSWCGNSYHRVMLAAGEFWEFSAPRYDGTMTTQLRFRLTEDGKTLLVSNEFDGKINPAQFSVKQPYNPENLMDPYSPVPAKTDKANGKARVDKQ